MVPVSLLIVAATAMISVLLPYAAENYPLPVRPREWLGRRVQQDRWFDGAGLERSLPGSASGPRRRRSGGAGIAVDGADRAGSGAKRAAMTSVNSSVEQATHRRS